MKNFEFHVPTDVLFGRNQESNLPDKLKGLGKKILMTYGGGSIKRSGLYDKLKELLKDFEIFELGGIEPNPRVSTVNRGVEICKKEGIDLILAVGGGSTIDCSKAMAAGAYYDGDAWDLVTGKASIESALPLAVVLTIAATGSEMDCAAVISNEETKEKLLMGHPLLLPRVSVLNPENTFSVPAYQTAAGAVWCGIKKVDTPYSRI